ncbi:MAG TPA: hypothetical protein VGC58_01655 [Candidatus Paceibacterota bacterium]
MNPEENPQNSQTPPIPQNPTQTPIRALRTFAGDVENALSKNKSSTATIMIAEQKRREERPELAPPRISTQTKNTTFFILGSMLLLLGIITVGTVYYIRSTEKVVIDQKNKSIISWTKEKEIPLLGLNQTQLYSKILAEKESFALPANSILYLNITDEVKIPASVDKILTLIGPKAPAELVRSLDNKYMIGIYSFDTNEPFIILKVSDYANSYPAMLKWEKDMVRDLSGVFLIPANLFGVGMVDEEYKNKDLRVLRDIENKSVLLYSFIDKNTIVITANENILSAILGKYIISQQSR